jgi:hypothetical protein
MKSMIKVNDGNLGGDVFYGSIDINGNSVSVCNHLKDENEVYKFRMTAKARAGFQTITDFEGTVKELPMALSKHTTVVEVARKYDNGKEYWFHVLTTKGGKWHSIDKNILEKLTVGDMHSAFSKMVDWNMWKKLNTKTWASMAFVMNA